MNDIILPSLPFKWEKKTHRIEHVIRLESDEMEICHHKIVRKEKRLGRKEKVGFAHVDENNHFSFWEI